MTSPWLLGGLVLGAGAIALAWYASGPAINVVCPTDDQKRKAFADVGSGALTQQAVDDVVAPAWERCGLKAEAEALRYAAKNPSVLKSPLALPTPPDAPKIPGTSISIPKTYPSALPGGPAYACDFSADGRNAAVMIALATSGAAPPSRAVADALTVFAQQLAYCGHMTEATKVGQRADSIRAASVAGVTGHGRRDACAPPWVRDARRRMAA